MNGAVAGLADGYVEQHAKFAFQKFNVVRVARDQIATASSSTSSA